MVAILTRDDNVLMEGSDFCVDLSTPAGDVKFHRVLPTGVTLAESLVLNAETHKN